MEHLAEVSQSPSTLPRLRPSRRWLQFSLRSFLMFVTVVALLIVYIVLPAERQRKAVKQVEAAQGGWTFDNPDLSGKKSKELADANRFAHFRYNVGEVSFVVRKDFFNIEKSRQVDWAGLSHTKFLNLNTYSLCDEDLQNIAKLKSLVYLNISGVQECRDFSSLKNLPDLKRIFVMFWNLNEEHFNSIGQIKALEWLDMRDVRFEGEPMKIDWSQLSNLKILQMQGFTLKNQRLDWIVQLKNVENFTPFHTPLTEEDVIFIGRMPALKSVDLRGTQLKAKNLSALSQSKTLLSITLTSDQLDVEGADVLSKIPPLERISLLDSYFNRNFISGTIEDEKSRQKMIDEINKKYPRLKIFHMNIN